VKFGVSIFLNVVLQRNKEILLGLRVFFNPEDGGDMLSPKYQLTFNGLHGVISQKLKFST
jgi:hypothetical protein